ncbi:hypothetical protein K488DRAFT_85278 [Vararia minispora EC-137]|uniref:Uncharacterized protein n=1 Tax=Vararia minispora EC-137 TaxID=1314806 RepID=A0ACB8QN42_9AGAM|nr:hypothetical protein K488DRAFT_85278 [Vararia minispora EC-137]
MKQGCSVEEDTGPDLRSLPTGLSRVDTPFSWRAGIRTSHPTGLSLGADSQSAYFAGMASTEPLPAVEKTFVNPEDKFWAMYLAESDKFDEVRMQSWKGDTDGILIFTGLFAATVATFTVQSTQLLSPTSTDTAILAQISQQLSTAFNVSHAPAADASLLTPAVPAYAIRVNTLWFLSLILSLCCALAATLMQQWTRRYLRAAGHRAAPQRRGPVHVYVSMGLKRFGLSRAVGAIVALLHAAVFLFFSGLLDFLLNLQTTVAYAAAALMAAMAAAYILLSAIPAVFPDAPYATPLSPLIVPLYRLGTKCAATFVDVLTVLARTVCRRPSMPDRLTALARRLHRACRLSAYSRKRRLAEYAQESAPLRIQYALRQVLKNIDEHRELEQLVDALRPLLRAPDGALLAVHLFHTQQLAPKLAALLASCPSAPTNGEPPHARVRRAHTVIAFALDAARRLGFDAGLAAAHDALLALADDALPALALVARTALAAAKVQALAPPYPALDVRCGYRADTAEPSAALANFTRFVCVLVHFAVHEPADTDADGPLRAYRALWEPVLRALAAQAVRELPRHATPLMGVNGTFARLLADAGLEGYVPAPPPAPGDTRDFKWALTRVPRVVVECLRTVAEAHPALPPPPLAIHLPQRPPSLFTVSLPPPPLPVFSSPVSPPPPRPSIPGHRHHVHHVLSRGVPMNSDTDAARASRLGAQAFAQLAAPRRDLDPPPPGPALSSPALSSSLSSSSSTKGAWVTIGPLQWGRRPMREFCALLCVWPHAQREFVPPRLDGCRALPRRPGFARVLLADAGAAARLVEAWAAYPPEPGVWGVGAYAEVVAEVWDGRGDEEGEKMYSTEKCSSEP